MRCSNEPRSARWNMGTNLAYRKGAEYRVFLLDRNVKKEHSDISAYQNHTVYSKKINCVLLTLPPAIGCY